MRAEGLLTTFARAPYQAVSTLLRNAASNPNVVEVLKKEQGYTDSHFPGWVVSVGTAKTKIEQPKKRAPAPQITEKPVDNPREDIHANVETA